MLRFGALQDAECGEQISSDLSPRCRGFCRAVADPFPAPPVSLVNASAGMDKILQSVGSRDGGISVTNDGATILRAIHVDNAAAKVLVDIAKTQASATSKPSRAHMLKGRCSSLFRLFRPAWVIVLYKFHRLKGRNSMLEIMFCTDKVRSQIEKISISRLPSVARPPLGPISNRAQRPSLG